MAQDSKLLELTADIVAAQVANNAVSAVDLPNLIQQVHQALSSLSANEGGAPAKTPMVSIRASVKPDYVVCMECGARHKTLTRHLRSAHSMTPEQYRNDYGLPESYSLSAPNYSERRRELARSIGLGSKTGERRAARRK